MANKEPKFLARLQGFLSLASFIHKQDVIIDELSMHASHIEIWPFVLQFGKSLYALCGYGSL